MKKIFKRNKRTLVIAYLLVLSAVSILYSYASGVSGYTKKTNANGCDACHSTHGLPNPAISVVIGGPDTLTINQTATYTVTISGGTGSKVGVDIAVSSGTLSNIDANLKLLNGELTHTSAKSYSGGKYVFSFNYKAPATVGSQTLYATGMSSKTNWNFANNKSITIINTQQPDTISWCNLQSPPTANIYEGDSVNILAQVYVNGITNSPGQGQGITAWIGYNSTNSNPSTWTNWISASYSGDAGNNDEYKAYLGKNLSPGRYYFASRFKLNANEYKYGGYSSSGGGFWDGTANVSGILNINMQLPSVPNLVSPPNNSNGHATEIKLVWQKSNNTENYHLQVSTDSNFSSFIINDSTLIDSTKQINSLTNNTKFYWRVRAKNISGASAWSQTWNFTTIVSLPSSVQLIYPLDKAKFTISDTINFVWNRTEPQVTKYWFEYSTDSNFSSSVIDSTILDTTYSLHSIFNGPTNYYWRVKAYNQAGWGNFSETRNFFIEEVLLMDESTRPLSFRLLQNYPNPFNSITVINYYIPEISDALIKGNVIMKIFDIMGREITTLINEVKSAGQHTVIWNADNLPSGIYYYKLSFGKFSDTKKLVLMK